MNDRRVAYALVLLALAGCEQSSQELPFEPETEGAVTRTVGPEGAVVSTPAGLSVRFPSGSLDRATEVTVVRRSGADVGAEVPGEVVAGTVFDIGPSGMELGEPATLSLKIPEGILGSANPLALTGVLVSGAEQRLLSNASVDLTAGILRTGLPRLGTVAVRVSDDVVGVDPESLQSGPALRASPSSATGGVQSATTAARTSTFTMECGDTGQVSCMSTDAISFTLSSELYDAVDGCVSIIDPIVKVSITMDEDVAGDWTGRATGSIRMTGTVHYQTGSDGTACGSGGGAVQSVEVDDTFELGTVDGPWTPFAYDASTGTITLPETSDGAEVLNCLCGSDIFESDQVWIGQTSEEIGYEGLSGRVTWSIRLSR